MLGDASIVRDEYECRGRIGICRAEVTDSTGVPDPAVQWATNPPQKLILLVSEAPRVSIDLTDAKCVFHVSYPVTRILQKHTVQYSIFSGRNSPCGDLKPQFWAELSHCSLIELQVYTVSTSDTEPRH